MQCMNKKKLPRGSFFYSVGSSVAGSIVVSAGSIEVSAGSGRTSSGVSSTGFFFLHPIVNTRPACTLNADDLYGIPSAE